MLGTFPKAFSQVATFQGYFPNWQLPKCAITQAAASQLCPSSSAWPPSPSYPLSSASLQPARRIIRPNLTFAA